MVKQELTPLSMATIIGYTTFLEYHFGFNSHPISMLVAYTGLFVIFGFLNRYTTNVRLYKEISKSVGLFTLYLFPAFIVYIPYTIYLWILGQKYTTDILVLSSVVLFITIISLLSLKETIDNLPETEEEFDIEELKEGNFLKSIALVHTGLLKKYLQEYINILSGREIKEDIDEYDMSEEEKEFIKDKGELIDKIAEHGSMVDFHFISNSIICFIASVYFYLTNPTLSLFPLILLVFISVSFNSIHNITREIKDSSFLSDIDNKMFSYNLYIFGYSFSLVVLLDNFYEVIFIIWIAFIIGTIMREFALFLFYLKRDIWFVHPDNVVFDFEYMDEMNYLYNPSPDNILFIKSRDILTKLFLYVIRYLL